MKTDGQTCFVCGFFTTDCDCKSDFKENPPTLTIGEGNHVKVLDGTRNDITVSMIHMSIAPYRYLLVNDELVNERMKVVTETMCGLIGDLYANQADYLAGVFIYILGMSMLPNTEKELGPAMASLYSSVANMYKTMKERTQPQLETEPEPTFDTEESETVVN